MLDKVRTQAAACKLCSLWLGRNKPVFARGNEESSVFICGMCPGPDENLAGYPFVGAAGQVLNAVLKAAFSNENFAYITNLVKCYVAPGTPLQPVWMDSCLPYFLSQIGLLKPKVIIALGKDVCNYLIAPNIPIEMRDLRGQVRNYFGRKLICTYHPSYLARGGGVKHKHFETVVLDFQKALEFI